MPSVLKDTRQFYSLIASGIAYGSFWRIKYH